MNVILRVWRQAGPDQRGAFAEYPLDNISPDDSFLEVMDTLNQQLIQRNEEPVAFDHDCREGICGSCSLMINGSAHGPLLAMTTCQLYMRHFQNGESITVEPWRATALPVIKDLIVDRSALDRILQASGYISVNTGEAPDANAIQVARSQAERAFEAASCIGCGACVAACPNASAMLFVAAKVSHLAVLPQGQPERSHRVTAMVEAMDSEGFGNCSNHYECMKACPKSLPISLISHLNREFMRAGLFGAEYGRTPYRAEYEE